MPGRRCILRVKRIFPAAVNSLEPTTESAPDDAPPTACVQCGSRNFSARTTLPVCEPCRISLVKYPFPGWVKLAATLVGLTVLVSLGLSREHVADAMTLMRARKMAREERWQDAFQNYQGIMDKHGDHMDVMLAYAEAALNSGHHEEASRTLVSLGGRSGTTEQIWKADRISAEMERAGRQRPLLPGSASLPLKVD